MSAPRDKQPAGNTQKPADHSSAHGASTAADGRGPIDRELDEQTIDAVPPREWNTSGEANAGGDAPETGEIVQASEDEQTLDAVAPTEDPTDVETQIYGDAPDAVRASDEEQTIDAVPPREWNTSGEANAGGDDPEATISKRSSPDETEVYARKELAANSEATIDEDSPLAAAPERPVAQSGDAAGTVVQKSESANFTRPKSSRKDSGSRSDHSHSSLESVVVAKRDVRFLRPGAEFAEYEIGKVLGEGGMGTVYTARQAALDRSVALKMIKTGSRVRQKHKDQFLSEAIVTGTLEHPNIVPVYDLGKSRDGVLFLAMKEVRGGPWSDSIDHLSDDENLDVLLRIADAMAFAHSRGIIHRDLKPANVMVGEFGEVLVMDWGLALPVGEMSQRGLMASHRSCGTPAYMAPEMVKGPFDRIGPTSDIYLMGAMLFRALTGGPPHTGSNIRTCMNAAAENRIVETDRDDELMTIAMKAMATNVNDRYQSMVEFQDAIRDYRSHSESIRLTEFADAQFDQATSSGEYRQFERSLLAFEEALELWSENNRACRQIALVRTQYAQVAFRRGDFDLAESQLDDAGKEHKHLLAKIRLARVERDSRVARLKRLKKIAAGLAASVFFTVTVAAVLVGFAWHSEAIAHEEAVLRFDQAQTAIERLTGASDALRNYPRLQPVRLNMLQLVSDYYSELSKTNAGSSLESQQLLFETAIRRGDVHELLGEFQDAISVWDQAITDGLARLNNPKAEQIRSGPLPALTNLKIGRARMAIGDTGGAEQNLLIAAQLIDENEPLRVSEEGQSLMADVMFTQAEFHHMKGEYNKATESLQKSRTIYEGLVDQAASRSARIGLATTLGMLSQYRTEQAELETAARVVAEAISVWDDLSAEDEEDLTAFEGLAVSHLTLANLERSLGINPRRALSGGVATYEALVEGRPEIVRYQFNLATARMNLAWWLNREGHTEQAMHLINASKGALNRLANAQPEESHFADRLAETLVVYGEILRDRGEFDFAYEQLERAVAHLEQRVESEQVQPIHRERLAETLLLIGQINASDGDYGLARDVMTAASEQLQAILDSGEALPRVSNLAAWTQFRLSWVEWDTGQSEPARQHANNATSLHQQLPPTPVWQEHAAWLLLYSPIANESSADDATVLLEQAAATAPQNSRVQRTLALARIRQGNFKTAAEIIDLSTDDGPAHVAEIRFLRAMLLMAAGDNDGAIETFAAGITLMNEHCPESPRLLRVKSEAAEMIELPKEPTPVPDADSSGQ